MGEKTNLTAGELFKNCNSPYVFEQVRKRLNRGESRALWRRLESEMQRGGIGAADTYFRSVFSELVQQVKDNVGHLRESVEE